MNVGTATSERLYALVRTMPRHDHETQKSASPTDGIYLFFEKGEHGRIDGALHNRIVRVGTHREDGRFPKRIRQHFGNAPSLVDGVTFENVSLTFEQGRIVRATGTPLDRLIKRLDTDKGESYLGEFAFGVNPSITYPMKDILYDEKIAGSLHLTPGNAYEDYSDNGNRSAIHWDLVLIQSPAWGGGEIWFDGVLVRKDGLFVLGELEDLNPERLG